MSCRWAVDCFEVTKDGSDTSGSFNVKDEAGVKKTIVLDAASSESIVFLKDRPIVEWQITVITGDSANAGFDGDAYLTVNGSDGSSSEVLLSNDTAAGGNFAVGSSSVFKVKQPSYGGVSYLQLRGDFNRSSTNWTIARVEMVNTEDNSKFIFSYNSSISNWYSTAYLYPQSTYVCKVRIMILW